MKKGGKREGGTPDKNAALVEEKSMKQELEKQTKDNAIWDESISLLQVTEEDFIKVKFLETTLII